MPFQTPSAILGPLSGHFGFCKWWASAPVTARLVFYNLTVKPSQYETHLLFVYECFWFCGSMVSFIDINVWKHSLNSEVMQCRSMLEISSKYSHFKPCLCKPNFILHGFYLSSLPILLILEGKNISTKPSVLRTPFLCSPPPIQVGEHEHIASRLWCKTL